MAPLTDRERLVSKGKVFATSSYCICLLLFGKWSELRGIFGCRCHRVGSPELYLPRHWSQHKHNTRTHTGANLSVFLSDLTETPTLFFEGVNWKKNWHWEKKWEPQWCLDCEAITKNLSFLLHLNWKKNYTQYRQKKESVSIWVVYMVKTIHLNCSNNINIT